MLRRMGHGRPPSLGDILGQERAVSTLQSAMLSNRVHHAWVFTGPLGVGKRTTAEAFAAALLDPTTRPNLAGVPEPEEGSEVQRLIAAGTHPDLHIITKELARYSDDPLIRERKLLTIPKAVLDEHLLRPIALAPRLGGGGLASKVFIVDEAELMDRSRFHAPVQNSLLKTLEEPPPGSVIILATSAEEMLLPTVRSRCQRLVFGPLDDMAMESWLARSGLSMGAKEREWTLRFARGSPGRAVLAVEGRMWEWADRLEPMLVEAERDRFTPGFGSTMASIADEWAANWVAARPHASKEAANLAGTRHLLAYLAERERRRLRDASAGGDEHRLHRSLRSLSLIARAERHVEAHVPLSSAMEALAAGLSVAGDDWDL